MLSKLEYKKVANAEVGISQGIYYKKSGKPRFLAWADMSKITATMRYLHRYPSNIPSRLVVKVHTGSYEEIRFSSANYRLDKDSTFIPIFSDMNI